MPAGIHYQDKAGKIEQLAADFHIDTEGRDGYGVELTGDYADCLAVGDSVITIHSRNRRADKKRVVGQVVELRSATHALVYWPDVNDSIRMRIAMLRKVS